jgi:hypothetical protein
MQNNHLTATCRALLLTALIAQGHALAQGKSPAPPPFFVEAADCTAALQARLVTRLTQARSEARDNAILNDTELGFVFIGVAYKEGLRNPEAEQMLKAAEKRWTLLNKADQDKRLTACSIKARQLMDDASVLERFIVKNRAAARVERLLEKAQK